MQLIVIRHGETASNLKGILQGQRVDDPLTRAGADEVHVLAPQLLRQNITALHSSPLRRARQTADLLAAALGLSVRITPDLAERDFGSLSGLTWETAAVQANDPRLKENDRNHLFDYRSFGGESVEQVRSRLRKFLSDCLHFHQEETIACVTHGGVIRLLYHEFRKEQPAHVSNTSLHTFEIVATVLAEK